MLCMILLWSQPAVLARGDGVEEGGGDTLFVEVIRMGQKTKKNGKQYLIDRILELRPNKKFHLKQLIYRELRLTTHQINAN